MGIDKTSLYLRATAENIPRQLVDQITEAEGLRLTSYRCPTGHVTIGWGHNLEAQPVPGLPLKEGVSITQDQAERLLITDILNARCAVLNRWPWTASLEPQRLAVLIDMAFNIGVNGLDRFRKMLDAVRSGDYRRAGVEMLDSKWAIQVKGRAERLSRQMVSGGWQ